MNISIPSSVRPTTTPHAGAAGADQARRKGYDVHSYSKIKRMFHLGEKSLSWSTRPKSRQSQPQQPRRASIDSSLASSSTRSTGGGHNSKDEHSKGGVKRMFHLGPKSLSWTMRNGNDSASSSGSGDDALTRIKRFNYVHPRMHNDPVLGRGSGVTPTDEAGETIRVFVSEKLFYSRVRGKTFRMHSNVQQEGHHDRQEGGDEGDDDNRREQRHVPFDIVGTTAHSQDKLILQDSNGEPMAIVVRKIVHYDRRYDVYGLEPATPHQRPANLQHKHHNLYLRARITESLKGRVRIDTCSGLDHFHTDVYGVERVKTGFLAGKTTLLTKMGRPAALVQQGAFPEGISGPAWDGTVAPGIDPTLVICLIAILDETNNI